MQKLILFLLCSTLSLNGILAQAETNIQQAIFFTTASADLETTAIESLDILIEKIKGMGDYQLELAAHTDSRGSNSFNEQLAIARAQTIRDYLEKKQVSTDQMQVQSYGEQMAGDDLNSEKKLQKNRRVDIIVHGWFWNGLSDIQDSLSQPLIQNFTINTAEDQLIEGERGGRFLVAANSFVDSKGNILNSPVEIQLIECYALGDMINLNLNTTAQNKILESGGMFKITAKANNEPVFLKKGGSVAVSIPTDDLRENMSLFYGENHGEDNSNMNWKNTKTPVASKLPQLNIANMPPRPSKKFFRSKIIKKIDPKDIDELVGLKKPKFPSIGKPYRPYKPTYEEIIYKPKGIEKIFMSKEERKKRSEAKREKRRLKYEKSLARYEEQKPTYDAVMSIYIQKMKTYQQKREAIIDEHGTLVINSEFFMKLQVSADAAYEKALARYPQDSIAYQKYRQKKIKDYEAQMEALTSVDFTTVKRYFLSVNSLGWANIDRFLKSLPSTQLLAHELNSSTASDAMVYLLIPDRNIILRMPYNEMNGFSIPRVPIGEKVKIFALKVENQKPYVASHELIVSNNMVVNLNYQPKRLRDIRTELEAL